MDPITALSLASTAVKVFMQVEPVIAQGIKDFKPVAIALYEKFTGKPITPDLREQLENNIDEMHSEFQKPIPPEDQQ